MADPAADRPRWDTLSVGGTRLAMAGGMPVKWIMPIVFVPPVLAIVTQKFWLFVLVPILWVAVASLYARNPHRPGEYLMWLISGAAFMSWRPWGGISPDPYGSPSDEDIYL